MGLKLLAAIILLLSMSCFAQAALIHGSIYDLVLDKQSDVLITVNSVPPQFIVSKDGTYQFELPMGNYTIKADGVAGSSEENVSIVDTNDYELDIVLAPEIDIPPEEYFNDTLGIDQSILPENITQTNQTANSEGMLSPFQIFIMIIAVVVIFIAIVLLGSRTERISDDSNTIKKSVVTEKTVSTPESDYLDDVLMMVRKEKRITQKDLRKQIPLSEAKISLIISDLESQGKLRKIKKGRGNILAYIKG